MVDLVSMFFCDGTGTATFADDTCSLAGNIGAFVGFNCPLVKPSGTVVVMALLRLTVVSGWSTGVVMVSGIFFKSGAGILAPANGDVVRTGSFFGRFLASLACVCSFCLTVWKVEYVNNGDLQVQA